MTELKTQTGWDFDAGRLPLDFANTAEWHASQHPLEKLNAYDDLVGWSLEAGLLDDTQAGRLTGIARGKPAEAAAVFKGALALREAIYTIFSAVAAGDLPPAGAMARFNKALADALGRSQLEPSGNGFTWAWAGPGGALDAMLGPILLAAADLLTSDDLARVGECADDRGCGYLFYDTSRNHSRRWCSMASCGNRAKALRHYRRSEEGQ